MGVFDSIKKIVSGDVAHDAADSGAPVKIGGYGKATAPTAANADGDRVNAWFDLAGRLHVTDDLAAMLLGGVTETAPGTDTASSGLNGRLQRLAQHMTSLIAIVSASQATNWEWKTVLEKIAGDDSSHLISSRPTILVDADTYISADDPTANFGARTVLGAGYKRKTLLAASGLADYADAEIVSAKLYIYNADSVSTTVAGTLGAYRILTGNAGWVEGGKDGTAGTDTDPTWNKKSVSPDVSWAGSAGLGTSGTDYSATVLSTAAFTTGPAGWLEFDLDLTEFAALLAANYGVLIQAYGTSEAGQVVVAASSEGTTAEQRPYFQLQLALSRVYLIADAVGATWANDATADATSAPIPTSGLEIPNQTSGVAMLSVYVPAGVNVWYAELGRA